jgi:hypothetical protein
MQEDAPGSRAGADRFYRGKIDRLFRGNQTGLILSDSGRELLFEFAQIRIAGPIRDFEALQEGMQVGFDVSRTSKGLRVTMLRTEGDRDPADLETQTASLTDPSRGSASED